MPQTLTRLVLNFPGFETTTSTHQIERLAAGGVKTAGLWGFDLTGGKIKDEPQLNRTTTHFTAKGEDWQTETRYVHFSWADIIEKYETVPYPKNLLLHFPGYAAFLFDGTARKYAKASRRYWGFTIYPILLMFLFAAIGWILGSWIGNHLGLNTYIRIALAVVFFLVFCRFPGDKLYVNLSVNDWAFARHMCFQSNPEIEERYGQFAGMLMREVKNAKADEIIIVGHSFGAIWAVMALSKALEQRPRLFKGKRVTFLAMGSSLLKIGLVRRAAFLREAINRVLSEPDLLWHEIQTKTDFVSFYKSEPFTPMKIEASAAEVIVHRVNFKKALSEQRHRKMMKSMYLAHRQYILYCDKPVHHDYQLRVFGPFFADELARDQELALHSPLVNPGLQAA